MPAALLPVNSTIVRSGKMLSTRARLQVGSIVAPERALADAVRIFLTPPRRTVRDRDRVFLAGGEGFVVPLGLARLSAWRFGTADRPAVILSHGWGGRGAQWRAFVPSLLAAGFQAVVFDHVGHGYSEGRQSSLIEFGRGLGAVAKTLSRREALAGLLCSNSPESRARLNLNQALYNLRLVLGEQLCSELLQVERQTVTFYLNRLVEVDILIFSNRLAQSALPPHLRVEACWICLETLSQAASLYQGDFLDGLSLDGCEAC